MEPRKSAPASSAPTAASASSYGQAAEPHVPGKKELLAASLFGDGGGASSRARTRRPGVASPTKTRPPQASAAAATSPAAAPAASGQPAAADLLLELFDSAPSTSAAPSASSNPPADPFGILGDLAAPTPRHTSAAVPTPPARPAAILDDLYGPTPPAASSPKLSGGFLPQAQSASICEITCVQHKVSRSKACCQGRTDISQVSQQRGALLALKKARHVEASRSLSKRAESLAEISRHTSEGRLVALLLVWVIVVL
ncbi:hypothetical protein WJX84_004826 [Apatococcus fuscideae]|uniref:Uncharacterized protein n=1 Tax=Apatococcus fuscideae TaxID=2026836 RepID=A0AAW1SYP3_9CHLO